MNEASTKYEAMMTMEIAWCRLNQLIKGNVLDGQNEAVHKPQMGEITKRHGH